MPVAVQLVEFSENLRDVIEGVRSLRVPSHSHGIPRAEIGINLFRQGGRLFTQTVNFVTEIEFGIIANALQLLNFHFEFCNRLLKVKIVRIHVARLAPRHCLVTDCIAHPIACLLYRLH